MRPTLMLLLLLLTGCTREVPNTGQAPVDDTPVIGREGAAPAWPASLPARVNGLALAPDGGVYAVGPRYAARLSPDGDMLWSVPLTLEARAVAATATGIVVAGEEYRPGRLYEASVALLSQDTGTVLAARTFGGLMHDWATSVAVTGDGAIYVGGITSSVDFPVTLAAWRRYAPGYGSTGFVARLSPDLVLVAATYLGVRPSAAYGLAISPAGDAVVVG